tara:strand:+ start:43 stop:453 length:411 start_codon:yes stop_codon:yes gene_type:complete
MNESDIAYIAGLFDGEGCVSYRKTMKKRGNYPAYKTWDIRLEISMTEQSIIRWVHEVLKVGTFSKKPPGKGQLGKKMQYRWRCGFRDAYYVCCLLYPYAHVKLDKIQKVIDHYADKKIMNGNIVKLSEYKKLMSLE